jgi:hypothetical protein
VLHFSAKADTHRSTAMSPEIAGLVYFQVEGDTNSSIRMNRDSAECRPSVVDCDGAQSAAAG